MEAILPTRPFTIEEYHAMGVAGILKPDERIELLDGEILTMPPIGAPHTGIVNRLTHVLSARFGARAVVQVQGPVQLSADSEPEPDVALLRPRDDYYAARHATPADVFALIEVADASLEYDRGRKLGAYARRGIAEYWIVDVRARKVTVYREPHGLGYGDERVVAAGGTVAFVAFPDDVLAIEVLTG